jgi:hypothetical protein
MAGLQFTAMHVRGLLGLSRTDLHRWLTQLPPFNQAPTQARTARRFTITDLAYFSFIALLHRRLGIPLSTISVLSQSLYDHVSRPLSLNATAAPIFLNQVGENEWEASAEARGSLSLVIDSEAVWNAVYEFIGLSMPAQRELALGLVSVNTPSSQELVRGRHAG